MFIKEFLQNQDMTYNGEPLTLEVDSDSSVVKLVIKYLDYIRENPCGELESPLVRPLKKTIKSWTKINQKDMIDKMVNKLH